MPDAFAAAMDDDLGVPQALGVLHETVRQGNAALDAGDADPVGKRLGFLLHEMLRETNTTGSKANDAEMLRDVLVVKEELERIREQVENVELACGEPGRVGPGLLPGPARDPRHAQLAESTAADGGGRLRAQLVENGNGLEDRLRMVGLEQLQRLLVGGV